MNNNKEIYALGIGHNTPVFLDLAMACGYSIAGLYHYNSERTGELDHGYKSLLTRDVPSEVVIAGSPARILRGVNTDETLYNSEIDKAEFDFFELLFARY